MKEKWSVAQINDWYAAQPWFVGCNYVPADAVNSVEMWSKATFNPERIRKELTRAAEIGMNSVRVFLPYIVWKEEGPVFMETFETFLQIADACGHRVLPILFDDCAFDQGADPVYGPQPDPVPGVHNSRWVPSPGFKVQDDPAQLVSCKAYVDALVGTYKDDPRILAWDLYNEPGNSNRILDCLPLLRYVFKWARANDPTQPLTSSLWAYTDHCAVVNLLLLELSDIVGLHTYGTNYQALIEKYAALDRPIFVTEWMHRPNENTILSMLPLFCQKKIGAWNWGLYQGRCQTHLSWETMRLGATPTLDTDTNATPADKPLPTLWQHDLLYPDGTPYMPEEIALMQKLTNRL